MWANRSFRSNQMSDVSKSLISLTKNERPWAIRSCCSEEMSDVSETLISLTKNEWIAHFFEQIAHLLILGQKMSDSLGNQMSEFPARGKTDSVARYWTNSAPQTDATTFALPSVSILLLWGEVSLTLPLDFRELWYTDGGYCTGFKPGTI